MAMQVDDDPLSAISVDYEAQSILLAAAHHDISALKNLLRTGSANVQDPETGFTPLHTAIGALGSCEGDNIETDNDDTLRQAEETVQLLFENGAIWNDLDAEGETPGCLAWRLGLKSIYDMMVDAGVRAELLLNRLDAFAPLEDEDEDEDEEDYEDEVESQNGGQVDVNGTHIIREDASLPATNSNGVTLSPRPHVASISTEAQAALEAAQAVASSLQRPGEHIAGVAHIQHHADGGFASGAVAREVNLSNPAFLASRLTVRPDRILDTDASGVMMSWETALMKQTADLILPSPGLKVLNVGHGMGIIDQFFADKTPGEHHIIEAHPDVLSAMKIPSTGFLAANPSATLHEGTWQEILPKLLEQGEQYDAIFFDTFAEDYAAFREFFSEYVVGLLQQEGRWSFFNGLGADRRVCYDVYTKVAEIDLEEAGFDVTWTSVSVPDLKEDFEGVKRSYFALDQYRLPVCRFVS